ncbi:MAG: hypothetical protein MUC36_15485 [Planctomycetes bacterium]|jgi:hypothetical protein|nr:hypothetical protein [Planctomycetota bacterium]
MDLGAFVQENKRWLVGVGIGGLCWLIGSAIVQAIYDPGSAASAKSLKAPAEVYDQAALSAATTEAEQLAAERARLQRELAFVQGDKFLPAGKGALDEYLLQIGRAMKRTIASAANEREVQFADANVAWDAANGPDEIRATLFGLELLDEVQKRLFAAHDQVRSKAPEARGLRALLALKLDTRRNRGGNLRTAKPGEVDLRDLVMQEHVTFQFQADEPVLLAFLESLRVPDRTLVLDSWQVVRPTRVGEPCTVKGMLHGLAFKTAVEGKQ